MKFEMCFSCFKKVQSLQKVVNDKRNDWDDRLDAVLLDYNATVQNSTKFSPFVVMFNR